MKKYRAILWNFDECLLNLLVLAKDESSLIQVVSKITGYDYHYLFIGMQIEELKYGNRS